MGKAVYIGRFTPGTGGVTAKNTAVYNELSSKTDIEKIDLTYAKKGNLKVIFRCIRALLSGNNTLIIGTAAKMRRIISRFLYVFNRRAMKKSVLIVMGGQFGRIVADDERYRKWVKEYKKLYVETEGMIRDLNSAGVTNVSLFPNCRKKPGSEIELKKTEKPDCVFFSLIRPQKGADTVLKTAGEIQNVRFHFYGNIDLEYRDEFLSAADALPNVSYHGVFSGSSEDVYRELNKYDILLFPTRWAFEGVPGVLVESKIAGLVPIVSDVCYNAELVRNNVDGIVLEENSPEALSAAITKLTEDADLLQRLKTGSRKSAERFYFETYIDELLNTLSAV